MDEVKKKIFIFLAILLFSTIFSFGCNTAQGTEEENVTVIRYAKAGPLSLKLVVYYTPQQLESKTDYIEVYANQSFYAALFLTNEKLDLTLYNISCRLEAYEPFTLTSESNATLPSLEPGQTVVLKFSLKAPDENVIAYFPREFYIVAACEFDVVERGKIKIPLVEMTQNYEGKISLMKKNKEVLSFVGPLKISLSPNNKIFYYSSEESGVKYNYIFLDIMNAGYGIFRSDTINITLGNGQIINVGDNNIRLPNYYVSYVLTQPKTIPIQVHYNVSNIPSAIFEDYIPITARYRYYIGDFASVKVIPRLLISYQPLKIDLDKYVFSIDLKQLEEYFVNALTNGTIDIIGIRYSDIIGTSTVYSYPNSYTYEYKYDYNNLIPNKLKDLFDKAREGKDEEYFVNHPKECGAPDYVESLTDYWRRIMYRNIFRPILICKFLYDFDVSDVKDTLYCGGGNSYISNTEDFIEIAEEALTDKIFNWDEINNWWSIFWQVVFCNGKCKNYANITVNISGSVKNYDCKGYYKPKDVIRIGGLGGISIDYECGKNSRIIGTIKFSDELAYVTLTDLVDNNYFITEGIHVMFFGSKESNEFRDDIKRQFSQSSPANRICARILCRKFQNKS